MGFEGEQLDGVMKAMPDMVGFSGYFDEGAALELAMEKLNVDDLDMIFALMDHGTLKGVLQNRSTGIKEYLTVRSRLSEALRSLQTEFDKVMRVLYR